MCPGNKDSINPRTGRGPHGVFEASRDKRAHDLTHCWRGNNDTFLGGAPIDTEKDWFLQTLAMKKLYLVFSSVHTSACGRM